LHKGRHQAEHLERLLRAVRIRPGGLELYLEIFGLEHIRRAVYKAGASLRVRYDDRLVHDLENAVGPRLVRLLGHRGATTRIETGIPASEGSRPRPVAPPPAHSGPDEGLDDPSQDDLDDF